MKSLIIIDTPDICKDCPCYNHNKCNIYGVYVEKFTDKKPNWCPLAPLPERIKLKQHLDNTSKNMYSILAHQYIQGYNACIDEIRGKNNDYK